MTIFEAVKAQVTPRMAAERYGLHVSRSGMVRCLFHDDATPSMKLYDDHYHCFGCQATGDVIRMTAKLCGVPDAEAANKLAEDFGIQREKTSVLAKLHRFQEQAEQERLCVQVLRDYLHLLEEWRTKYAPKTQEEAPNGRFVEALLMVDCIEYLLDTLKTGKPEERAEVMKSLLGDGKITRLQEYTERKRQEAV
jgi:hypothetical protein